MIFALEKALELDAGFVSIFSDSELIVRQVKGEYKVKDKGLKPLYLRVKELLGKIGRFSIQHVSRDGNKVADRLANLAIDSQSL